MYKYYTGNFAMDHSVLVTNYGNSEATSWTKWEVINRIENSKILQLSQPS